MEKKTFQIWLIFSNIDVLLIKFEILVRTDFYLIQSIYDSSFHFFFNHN